MPIEIEMDLDRNLGDKIATEFRDKHVEGWIELRRQGSPGSWKILEIICWEKIMLRLQLILDLICNNVETPL